MWADSDSDSDSDLFLFPSIATRRGGTESGGGGKHDRDAEELARVSRILVSSSRPSPSSGFSAAAPSTPAALRKEELIAEVHRSLATPERPSRLAAARKSVGLYTVSPAAAGTEAAVSSHLSELLMRAQALLQEREKSVDRGRKQLETALAGVVDLHEQERLATEARLAVLATEHERRLAELQARYQADVRQAQQEYEAAVAAEQRDSAARIESGIATLDGAMEALSSGDLPASSALHGAMEAAAGGGSRSAPLHAAGSPLPLSPLHIRQRHAAAPPPLALSTTLPAREAAMSLAAMSSGSPAMRRLGALTASPLSRGAAGSDGNSQLSRSRAKVAELESKLRQLRPLSPSSAMPTEAGLRYEDDEEEDDDADDGHYRHHERDAYHDSRRRRQSRPAGVDEELMLAVHGAAPAADSEAEVMEAERLRLRNSVGALLRDVALDGRAGDDEGKQAAKRAARQAKEEEAARRLQQLSAGMSDAFAARLAAAGDGMLSSDDEEDDEEEGDDVEVADDEYEY